MAALTGRGGSHRRFLLAVQLQHLADLGELIDGLDAEMPKAADAQASRARPRPPPSHPTAPSVTKLVAPRERLAVSTASVSAHPVGAYLERLKQQNGARLTGTAIPDDG